MSSNLTPAISWSRFGPCIACLIVDRGWRRRCRRGHFRLVFVHGLTFPEFYCILCCEVVEPKNAGKRIRQVLLAGRTESMRICGKRKITYGWVVQTFNDEGKLIEQEFAVGDNVDWEGDDLEPLTDIPDYSAPFHMVQPTNMAIALIGNLSEGFGAVGPFMDFDDATKWADGQESWILTLQNPNEEFDDPKNPRKS